MVGAPAGLCIDHSVPLSKRLTKSAYNDIMQAKLGGGNNPSPCLNEISFCFTGNTADGKEGGEGDHLQRLLPTSLFLLPFLL